MIIVVNDANILIDLVKLQLLPNFFGLDFQFYTTDLVLDELYDEQQEELQVYIDNGTLIVDEISAFAMEEILDLQLERPQLSEQDCSAFHQAQNLHATLITSDNNLRRFAKEKELDVHGHLWVFDQLVENNRITPEQAAEKLDDLCHNINPRLKLPVQECENRKNIWNGN